MAEEPMVKAADFAAVAIDVDSIDDHRQPECRGGLGGRQALK